MKYLKSLGFLACFVSASCSLTTMNPGTQVVSETSKESLSAEMKIQSTIKIGEPVQLIFTVYNNTESPKQFCKWHTPFEPLMSKYLEIKDANGVEMNYQGPMAKRIMPPPAISYIVVKSKESISATVNLGSAYNLTGPSKYTIKYTGNEMSGLPGVKAASFVYRE